MLGKIFIGVVLIAFFFFQAEDGIRDRTVTGVQTCALPISPDWMPILDESPLRGFWIATGMSGHGFKLSPAVGEMMAALITGAAPQVNPAPFALGRFSAKSSSGTFVASYLGS